MNNSIDQQFVEFVVKSLVGNPDAVQVERRIDEKGVLLELTVDPEDLGRVIGKRGATAQSLRTLLRALGTKNDARYNLKIVDNGEPREHTHHDNHDDHHQADENRSDDSSSNDTTTSDDSSDTPTQDDDSATTTTSSNDLSDLSDDEDMPAKEDDHEDALSKTRKELEELDDLDV